MKSIPIHKIDDHRRLCIHKDIRELDIWIQSLEAFIEELNHYKCIEKQIIKSTSIADSIRAIQRKTVLMIASLCKYEQELKIEYEYGKGEYDSTRSKFHVQRQQSYSYLLKEQHVFKSQIYTLLKHYKRSL